MAQLNFPDNPINGQLYPNPCPTGVTQYKWDSSTGMWRIVGVATGVIPGQYGDSVTVGQFTVDVSGNITQASNIPIRSASTTESGIVPLTNATTSISESTALTAKGGKYLQDQIGNLDICTVPDHTNVVAALNDLQSQSIQLQTNAMIWCGYYNALEGDITFVSITGQRLGYQIGQELPLPSTKNGGDMFIVLESGNPYTAGDYNAPDKFIEAGNWIISESVKWSEVKAKGNLTASDISCFTIQPLTANNVQGAITQITQLLRSGGIGGASVSTSPPKSPYQGQLWWDNESGYFYIYYRDPNGDQWVEVGGGGSESLQASGGGTVTKINTGVGLIGGPIQTEGTLSLALATSTTIGGMMPGRGIVYDFSSGRTDVSLTSSFTESNPDVAFSQAGANALAGQISALAGVNILAGTYDAETGVLLYATPAGASKGFVSNQPLPAARRDIDNYYVIVTIGGSIGPDGPGQKSGPGDWWIVQGDENTIPEWFLIDYQSVYTAAENISVNPVPGIEYASNVQSAIGALEQQAQDRVQFVRTTTSSLKVDVSDPDLENNRGTTLTLGVDFSSVTQRGIVQLTNDLTGNSEELAVSQSAIAGLNSRVAAISGTNVLAGTYNANTGRVVYVTPAGAASGFIAGQNAPESNLVPNGYYLIVTVPGGFGPPGAPIPPGGIKAGYWFLNNDPPGFDGQWLVIDYSQGISSAELVSTAPIPNLSATNVQTALTQIEGQIANTITDVDSISDGIDVVKTVNNSSVGFKETLELLPAKATTLGGVAVPPGNGLNLTQEGYLIPAIAKTDSLGVVKVGSGIQVDSTGTISVSLPSSLVTRIVEGEGLNVQPSSGVGNVVVALDKATQITLGGVKVGNGLSVAADGTLSVAPSSPTKVDDLDEQFDGFRYTFSISLNGSPLALAGSPSIMVVVNGLVKTPFKDYVVSGDTITFTSPPARGDHFYGVIF